MLQVTAPQNFQKLAQYKSVAQMEIDRETLIMTHLSKVKYIADRIAAKLPSSVERDDLYGAGVIGLIDAVERYDPSRGVAFTTFAEMRVRGAILDNLRSLDWASRTVRRRAREVQNAYGQIEKLKGAPATEEEVAMHLRMPLKELHNILREISGLNVTDLDEQDEKTGLSLMDTIYDTGASPFEAYEESERRQRLSEVVDKLPERERQVIALYYVEELNMKEIGAVLGITESRVSQLRTQAVVRMRANLAK